VAARDTHPQVSTAGCRTWHSRGSLLLTPHGCMSKHRRPSLRCLLAAQAQAGAAGCSCEAGQAAALEQRRQRQPGLRMAQGSLQAQARWQLQGGLPLVADRLGGMARGRWAVLLRSAGELKWRSAH
jgi:hypothetical protein